MAKYPNCDAKIAWDAPRCSACSASFEGESSWRPAPESPDEEQNLSRKYPPQKPPEPLSSRAGNAFWLAFKLCLSAVMLLVALLMGSVAARPPADWTFAGFAGGLLFFTAVLWIDYTKPSRAMGLAGIMVAIGLGLVARNISAGGTVFPRPCTGRAWLMCQFENELYRLGGLDAVAALWYFIALLVMYGSYLVIMRSRAANRK
jgi:hypothetical protein